ncbi:DNA replication protein DnaD [Neobacillus mesonae]|uniref:DNA replication protein DnaD n=1 Tax=Neobacillus mesonae TaxID=1193713 RepID=UPI002E229133|nr:DNA replication protein DnaD [Neobacillus mesonae]
MMVKFRMVRTNFWSNPIVLEEMTPEDKYFYLYLLTNPYTTQIGIYKITKKQMAFDLGYSIESVQSLMVRFIEHHKLIRYNPATRELAIRNWGKDNLDKCGKPVMDCILSELKEVEDRSLIRYVAELIRNQDVHSLYESFYNQEITVFSKEDRVSEENDTYITECGDVDDSFAQRNTIRGQKEKEKQKEKQQLKEKQQNAFYPSIEKISDIDQSLLCKPKTEDVKEMAEFWDANGFSSLDVNAKQQQLTLMQRSKGLLYELSRDG